MTTNPLERAVIAAARSFAHDASWMQGDPFPRALSDAIEALEAWEATQAPEVREIGWHEVAEGDLLKSVKNGKFYPVVSVQKNRDGYRIAIQLNPQSVMAVTRPSAAEPSAFVKRGQAGAAVDVFVNVFSSGGK